MMNALIDERALMRDSLQELEFYKVLEAIVGLAISPLGEEIIAASFPTEDTGWLRQEHSRLDEVARLLQAGEEIPLEGLTDVRTALHKTLLQNAYLLPAELLAVRDVMRSSRLVQEYFSTGAREDCPAMGSLTVPLHKNRLLEKHIADAIDDTGAVRDTASRELARIRREIFDTSNRLRQRLERILRKMSEEEALSDEYITQRDGRFVLPMKTEYKRHVPGIIHGSSSSGSTVFLEPTETFEMNNELSLLYSEEQREIVRILTTLTAEIGGDARDFLRSIEILGHLDALLAKARYANRYNGQKPDIVDFNEIVLQGIRHPLLVQAHGKKTVVPLTIEFSDDVGGHLISGPNAGGKTVALKSVGLNVAMALSGIFPLGYCRTNYRSVFSAIGDKQSIENDVSTFSSQLIRLNDILCNSSPVSLILVDEITAGTDPQEGAALAVGIVEGFADRKTFFIVTTHQSSLKSYALARTGISNGSMEFDPDKLEPTYRFLAGVPGNSYAFVLAKKIGLPPKVMERAQEYLGDRHSELEKSIEVIQRYRREAEVLRQEAATVKSQAEATKKKYEEKFDEFRTKYNQLTKAAKEEAAQIVGGANKLVENTIREIREQQRPVADIRKEYEEAQKAVQKAIDKAKEAKPAVDTGEFSEGDTVLMEDTITPGTIVAIDRDSNSAVVEFGSMKFRTTIDKLKRTALQASTRPIKRTEVAVKMDAKTSIDLRGKYADEAINDVENAVADALQGHITTLTIIHGKGTGALRQAVHRFLEIHPAVISYRLGELNEGGAGVTIVELK